MDGGAPLVTPHKANSRFPRLARYRERLRREQRFEEWQKTPEQQLELARLVEGGKILFEQDRAHWSAFWAAYAANDRAKVSQLTAEWERKHPATQEQQDEANAWLRAQDAKFQAFLAES
jgi:hypothetical protein